MALGNDVLLGMGVGLLFLVLGAVNLYTIVHFQMPGDKMDNKWTKLVIWLGFQLCSFTVMMVAADAANAEGNPMCDKGYLRPENSVIWCGGFDFDTIWRILYMAVFVYLCVIIPFATFYWEASEEIDGRSPLKEALCYEMYIVLLVVAITVPVYMLSDEKIVEVPTKVLTAKIGELALNTYTLAEGNSVVAYIEGSTLSGGLTEVPTLAAAVDSSYKYPVRFEILVASYVGFLGWFVFSLFVGVGLVALPFDLISAYINRPVGLDAGEVSTRKADLQIKANEILETSVQLKRTRSESSGMTRAANHFTDRIEVNKLANMMHALERDVEDLEACENIKQSYNPIIPYISLVFGVFSTVVSIFWILQMVLYTLLRKEPLLNSYLLSFDTWFPMFGVVTYAIFSVYLLLALIKGCFKLGMRFLCCCQIHTMAPGKTEVNSFLFNLAVLMLCTYPLVHFVVRSFSGYASYAQAYLLFEVQMGNMAFFRDMFRKHAFDYITLGMSGLTLIGLLLRPSDGSQFAARKKRMDTALKKGKDYTKASTIEMANRT